jgi:uncharacterized UBP type Zn finger protein
MSNAILTAAQSQGYHDRHLTARHVRAVKPSALGCEDCLRTGARWVHLRICLECGHVGCCDESPNQHAARHFHDARHPIVRSFEPGEEWGWCFEDEEFFESLGAPANTYGRHFG